MEEKEKAGLRKQQAGLLTVFDTTFYAISELFTHCHRESHQY